MFARIFILFALCISTAPVAALASTATIGSTVSATDPECPDPVPDPGYTGEDPCPTPGPKPIPPKP